MNNKKKIKPPTTAKAGYRFVKLNDKVVPGPLKLEDIDLSKPQEDRISGSITVLWSACSPLCVGEEKNGWVVPTQLGDEFVLPGSSLKGMIRSVFEIATFSKLGQVNDHYHYGYRDFNDEEYKADYAGKSSTNAKGNLKAGWLRKNYQNFWEFSPASDPEYDLINYSEFGQNTDDWNEELLREKYRILQRNAVQDQVENKQIQYIVCGGRFFGNRNMRQHEALFTGPKNSWVKLPEDFMEIFFRMNGKPGPDPEKGIDGNLQAWVEMVGYAGDQRNWILSRLFPGIPVFYVGTPPTANNPAGIDFHISVSRFFKAPLPLSLGDVINNSLPDCKDVPRDMTELVFGFVDQDKQTSNQKGGDIVALKGRVSFGWGVPEGKIDNDLIEEENRAFGSPKPSFWPYYLHNGAGIPVDYRGKLYGSGAPAKPKISGRKRYPVRAQLDTLQEADNPKMQTHIKFLKPGCTFKSQIKFKNLHEVELGALLWAITFGGDNGQTYYHGLGHAKGFGYGQIKAELSEVKGVTDYINTFEKFMEEQAPGWKSSHPIEDLLAIADPEVWKGRQNELGYLPLGDHKELKKSENLKKLGTPVLKVEE